MRFVKPLWINSLSLKVLLAYVVGVVLSITLISFATFLIVITQSRYFVGKDIAEFANNFSEHMQFDSNGTPVGFDAEFEEFVWMFDSLKQEIAYRILDESQRVVLFSAPGAEEEFWRNSDEIYKRLPGSFEFEHQGVALHGATVAVKHQGQVWYLQLAASTRLHSLTHKGIALRFMGAGIIWFSLVLLFVFGICCYITLKYTLKPLRNVSESAAAISPRSIHARLAVEKVPYEIVPLVNSFNHVLDRLERGYRLQQEFLATAAHELKTPLALIRAQIEVKENSKDRDLLLNDVAHMTRQVQQLLLLAEVSEEQNYHLAPVDVAEVVNEVASYLQPMAKLANVQITITHLLDANWQADRAALFVLIKNLLENAIQHAPDNSEIKIEITTERVTVRDWGPGMDEEQLQKIFTRFWRGAHRRDHGAGLGMTICQEIAQAHGWELTAHRAEPGLCFRLERVTRDQ